MWEIHKSGSVRGIEVLHMVGYCGTLDTERQEQQRKQIKPKGRTILCLLDALLEVSLVCCLCLELPAGYQRKQTTGKP